MCICNYNYILKIMLYFFIFYNIDLKYDNIFYIVYMYVFYFCELLIEFNNLFQEGKYLENYIGIDFVSILCYGCILDNQFNFFLFRN